MWARSGGNASITASQENAPKGESHERCRRETKPARIRRAKAAQRVTKPWTRTVAGLERPRSVDRRILQVLKGTKVHERCPLAAAGGRRSSWATLWRKGKLDEDSLGGLTVAQSVRRRKPAQPVQRANGTAGLRNQ